MLETPHLDLFCHNLHNLTSQDPPNRSYLFSFHSFLSLVFHFLPINLSLPPFQLQPLLAKSHDSTKTYAITQHSYRDEMKNKLADEL